jgi:hypothetical protein
MSTIQQSYPTKTRIRLAKVEIIRSIIEESGRPITSLEISRRVLSRVESSFCHMLPSEVSAIIRIHLRGEVQSDNIYDCAGALILHHTISSDTASS